MEKEQESDRWDSAVRNGNINSNCNNRSNAEAPVSGNGGDCQLTKCVVEKPMRRLVSARATT